MSVPEVKQLPLAEKLQIMEVMIRIVASARRDLDEGFQFYELQEIGLGERLFPESI